MEETRCCLIVGSANTRVLLSFHASLVHSMAKINLVVWGSHLSIGGDFTGDEEPEETFGQGLGASGSFGQDFLALRDGVTAEPNSFIRVQDGGLAHETLDSSHTSIDL